MEKVDLHAKEIASSQCLITKKLAKVKVLSREYNRINRKMSNVGRIF